jgi:hypothetical protein
MKQKDITYLAGVAFFVAVISFVLAGFIFKAPAGRNTTVPIVQPIQATFPDVKNDPAYSSFLNSRALDPTESIQIGNNQNKQPFNNR